MIIEIIGLAGAGKSTLTDSLKNSKKFDFSPSISLPKLATLHWQFAYGLKHIIPLLFYSKKGYLLQNIKLILHMNSMLKTLKKSEFKNIKLFDQGIIYQYASYCYFGFNIKGRSYLDDVFEKTVKEYLCIVNSIIYLKVNDEIALKRVATRKSYHMLNEFSEQEILDFISYYSTYYEQVIELANKYDVSVIEIQTSNKTAQEVHYDVQQALTRICCLLNNK